jgi:hypothetical protein
MQSLQTGIASKMVYGCARDIFFAWTKKNKKTLDNSSGSDL